MRNPKSKGVFFLAMLLTFLLAASSYAAHEKDPDTEHGESIATDATFVGGPSRVGGGDVTFEVKKAGNVTFSHDSHVGGVGLKCTDCHDSIYVTKAKHKTASMAQMRKGKSCGVCHNGKKAFDVKADCNKCHKK